MSNLPERRMPFKFSTCGLPGTPILLPEEFTRELRIVPPAERMSMVRTWVQERSPAAFSDVPYLWEAIRDWLANRHKLSPRQIGLAGSAQIGFSTNPKKAYAPFNKNGSDLDFYIVSDNLFTSLEREARLFVNRQLSMEKSDFVAQAQTAQRALDNSYIDLYHIPTNNRYPLCSNLKNDALIIIDKLKLSGYDLRPSHFRIYRDWGAKASWTKVQAKSWVENLPK